VSKTAWCFENVTQAAFQRKPEGATESISRVFLAIFHQCDAHKVCESIQIQKATRYRKQLGPAERGTPWRCPSQTFSTFSSIFRSVMCALPAKTASGVKKSGQMGRPNLITAGSRRRFAKHLPCAGDRKGVWNWCPQFATRQRLKFVPAIRAKQLWRE